MLVISTWLWGDKYGPSDVLKLFSGCKRHLRQPFEFRCVTDNAATARELQTRAVTSASVSFSAVDIWDHKLLTVKGCFARLRMFDPEWQHQIGLSHGDRLVCMDLDSIVTGLLDPLFNRAETFMILQGANAANPCPFNGSLMMLRAGHHPDVWSDFTLEKAQAVPFYEFPDDQGWLHHKLPKAAGWKVGSQSGVYAFMKPGWPTVQVQDIGDGRQGKQTDDLPTDARLVVFPGWRSPEKFGHLPWVKQNWAA